MVRLIVILVLIVLAIVALYFMLVFGSRTKHRAWVPGSRPMAKPPAGKQWAYDVIKEEWYLEDE